MLTDLPENSTPWIVRPATEADIDSLLALRRQMFESMGRTDPAALDRMAGACALYLAETLPGGEFRAWVAQAGNEIVGAGGLVIRRVPPGMRNLAGREGYIMNVVTRPAWRRQGIARAIMQAILDCLRAEGIPVARLRASTQGQPLYEALGFVPADEMKLEL